MGKTNIDILLMDAIGTVNPNIYGHFVEHLGGVVYDGIWVGENSDIPNINGFRKELIDKLRLLNPPVIRWPGGCFAETYDWRDGIGPRSERPTTVNWWYMNDGLYESNQVGTHEFVEFCRLVNSEPYFALNATTTTVLEGRNWIEYCNMPEGTTTLAKLREKNGSKEPFGIKYWGLGNENWGGGGAMTPEDYCAIYRKYGIISKSVYPDGYYIACGANESIPDWTAKFFQRYKEMYTEGRMPPMSGYSLHYYVSNFGRLGGDDKYTDAQWYETLRIAQGMEPFLKTQIDMIDAAMPDNNLDLIVDEWGLWQQYYGRQALPGRHLFAQENTMRDALVAAVTLNIFNNYCHRVKMANVAQLVNCIQALFLAREEKFVATTTYYVYDMFKEHMNARAVRTLIDTSDIGYNLDGEDLSVPNVSCSASVSGGILNLTLANLSIDTDQEITLSIFGGTAAGEGTLTLLNSDSDTDGNTFDEPEKVIPRSTAIKVDDGKINVGIPKAAVARIALPITEYK